VMIRTALWNPVVSTLTQLLTGAILTRITP